MLNLFACSFVIAGSVIVMTDILTMLYSWFTVGMLKDLVNLFNDRLRIGSVFDCTYCNYIILTEHKCPELFHNAHMHLICLNHMMEWELIRSWYFVKYILGMNRHLILFKIKIKKSNKNIKLATLSFLLSCVECVFLRRLLSLKQWGY